MVVVPSPTSTAKAARLGGSACLPRVQIRPQQRVGNFSLARDFCPSHFAELARFAISEKRRNKILSLPFCLSRRCCFNFLASRRKRGRGAGKGSDGGAGSGGDGTAGGNSNKRFLLTRKF